MRFDRALGQRGMAAAAGTRRRDGDRWRRPCRRCWRRRMRRCCRTAPMWYQVRIAGPGVLGRHRALPGRRRRNRRLPRSPDKGVQPETERHHQRQRERHGPAQPAPRRTSSRHPWLTRRGRAGPVPQRRTGGGYQRRHHGQGRPPPLRSLGRRGQQLLQAYPRQHLRRPADRVVLLDQRPGVGPDGLSDAADVPPRVEVAAAPGVVVALDPPDNRFPDPGPLTDLSNAETGSLAGFRQSCTDRHAAPPQLCRPAYRPRGQERFRPHRFTRSPPRIGCLVLLAASRSVSGPPGRPSPSRPRRRDSPKTRLGWPLRSGRSAARPAPANRRAAQSRNNRYRSQLGRAHAETAKPVPSRIFPKSCSRTPDQRYLHPAVNAVHPADIRSYSAGRHDHGPLCWRPTRMNPSGAETS